MTTRSLRSEARALLGDQLRWDQGWRGGVWNPFWQVHPEDYPFCDAQGHASLRAFMNNLRWPTIVKRPTHPNNAKTPYSENVQGVAPYVSSDGKLYWVFARKSKIGPTSGKGYITILDASQDPTDEAAIVFNGEFHHPHLEQDEFYHFGDPAVDGDLLLIPMESRKVIATLLIYKIQENADHVPDHVVFLSNAKLSQQDISPKQAPWVAVFRELVFSSYFKDYPKREDHPEDSPLFVYKWNKKTHSLEDKSEHFTLINKDLTPAKIWRWQGCDITPGGRIFLVSDRRADEGGGLHFFDLTTGIRLGSFSESGDDSDHELEGVAAFDTSPFTLHHTSPGSIIVCVLNTNFPARDRTSVLRWDIFMQEPGDAF